MSTRRTPPPIAVALLLATLIVGLQALLVPLFAGPAANLAPRDLPVVVAGPAPAANVIARRLAEAQPGAFEITVVADAATADQALRDRRAYVAFIAGPNGMQLRIASAASPTVAALLTQAAQQLGTGQPVQVTDVVRTDPDDPRGAGFASGFLPLAMTAIVAGIALAVAVRRRAARLVGLGVFAVLTGLVGAAVLRYWLGVLPGSYWAEAGAIGLFALAVSAGVAGLAAALGRAGLGLGVLVIFLIGNPLSAVAAAPELLPQPWGAVGQWLPVGGGGTLLRSVAYFDGAGGTAALWTLAGWAVVGLALVVVGRAVLVQEPTPVSGSAAQDARQAAAA